MRKIVDHVTSSVQTINQTIDRVATRAQVERDSGLAPFSSITEDRIKVMEDNDLVHAIQSSRAA